MLCDVIRRREMVTRGQLRLPALSAFFLQIFVGSRGVLDFVAPSSPHFLPTNPSGSRSGAASGQHLSPSGLFVNSLKKPYSLLERALPARSLEPAGHARPGVHTVRDHTNAPGAGRTSGAGSWGHAATKQRSRDTASLGSPGLLGASRSCPSPPSNRRE